MRRPRHTAPWHLLPLPLDRPASSVARPRPLGLSWGEEATSVGTWRCSAGSSRATGRPTVVALHADAPAEMAAGSGRRRETKPPSSAAGPPAAGPRKAALRGLGHPRQRPSPPPAPAAPGRRISRIPAPRVEPRAARPRSPKRPPSARASPLSSTRSRAASAPWPGSRLAPLIPEATVCACPTPWSARNSPARPCAPRSSARLPPSGRRPAGASRAPCSA
mmetsp:Transcript_1173/g.3107  ORF Transcript_1173/g.3107 Transcript_1173/m.3107 type:complete len:220 (-) Transcript_1173:247-906(-)